MSAYYSTTISYKATLTFNYVHKRFLIIELACSFPYFKNKSLFLPETYINQ